jgi:hypothetical protein
MTGKQQRWQGKIIVYSKYSGKVANLIITNNNLVIDFGKKKLAIEKNNINSIDVGVINFSQRILNSTFPLKIVIDLKDTNKKIEIAAVKGILVTRAATFDLFNNLGKFAGKKLPNFEANLVENSSQTIKRFTLAAIAIGVVHFVLIKKVTLVEIGLLLLLVTYIIGELINKSAKSLPNKNL